MAENAKRINVTLPAEQVARIKELAAEQPATYPSVSAFVSEAVTEALASEDAHKMLLEALYDQGGEPAEEDRAWADEALRLAEQIAAEHKRRAPGAA